LLTLMPPAQIGRMLTGERHSRYGDRVRPASVIRTRTTWIGRICGRHGCGAQTDELYVDLKIDFYD